MLLPSPPDALSIKISFNDHIAACRTKADKSAPLTNFTNGYYRNVPEISCSWVVSDDIEIDLDGKRSFFRQRFQDFAAVGGFWQCDEERAVETTWSDHSWIDNVGSIRCSDNIDPLPIIQSVQFR